MDRKFALDNAQHLPPWPSVTFRQSGKTYYFPFRLKLTLIRHFQESLVRPEFAYVAENLLLRGGYGKTHFQADQTTLQSASQMGALATQQKEMPQSVHEEFAPRIAFSRRLAAPPRTYLFNEMILQCVLKNHLSAPANLSAFLSFLGLGGLAGAPLEILGEKALPEGHVDVLIKDAAPIGTSRQIPVEVKLGVATTRDVEQLANYVRLLGKECVGGALVARGASRAVRAVAVTKQVVILSYFFDGLADSAASGYGFTDLVAAFHLATLSDEKK
ncbi:MAG: hypothetical protein HY261_01000 [Chloroflexi bacterium]|nr:hypothetical protein [Chloroflexota bacterium]